MMASPLLELTRIVSRLEDELRRTRATAHVALDLAFEAGAPADLCERVRTLLDGPPREPAAHSATPDRERLATKRRLLGDLSRR